VTTASPLGSSSQDFLEVDAVVIASGGPSAHHQAVHHQQGLNFGRLGLELAAVAVGIGQVTIDDLIEIGEQRNRSSR
jgi:hypothetical protein